MLKISSGPARGGGRGGKNPEPGMLGGPAKPGPPVSQAERSWAPQKPKLSEAVSSLISGALQIIHPIGTWIKGYGYAPGLKLMCH